MTRAAVRCTRPGSSIRMRNYSVLRRGWAAHGAEPRFWRARTMPGPPWAITQWSGIWPVLKVPKPTDPQLDDCRPRPWWLHGFAGRSQSGRSTAAPGAASRAADSSMRPGSGTSVERRARKAVRHMRPVSPLTGDQGAGWVIVKAPRMSPTLKPRARSSGYSASSLAETSGAMAAPWHRVHTGCVPMAFM